MTQEQIDAIPRKEAKQVMAESCAPGGGVVAIEQALNLEWWRGYHAAKREKKD